MKTVLTAVLVAAALGLTACDPDSDGVGAVCEPSTFTTANPAAAEDYCIDLYTAFCDRAFSDCTVELGMTAYFANVTECLDALVSACTSTSWSTTGVNSACAASCLRTVRTADCSLFEGPEPMACDAATGTVGAAPPPTPPACTQTITAGTIQDTIVDTDPLYSSYPSRTYCLSLAAGQHVTLTTSAPTSGTPIDDTILHLLSPTGAQLSYNDDYTVAHYYSQIAGYSVSTSGTYLVVVRGYGGAVGSYRLTVSTY